MPMEKEMVMRRIYRLLIPITLLLSVTLAGPACGGAAAPAETNSLAGTYVANASDFASKTATDWSKADPVRVELGEFYFEPDNLTFEAGLPYKIELVNVGEVKHEFTAGGFFASVAWRKAESAESEVKVPYFTEIEVFSGRQVDPYFVPVTPGTYELLCEIEGHLEAGMKGTVTVTGKDRNTPKSPRARGCTKEQNL